MSVQWTAKPHVGSVPVEHAAGPLFDGEPADVCAAYSVALARTVKSHHVEARWAVRRSDDVAKRDCRRRKMFDRRDVTLDPVTRGFLSSHGGGRTRRC